MVQNMWTPDHHTDILSYTESIKTQNLINYESEIIFYLASYFLPGSAAGVRFIFFAMPSWILPLLLSWNKSLMLDCSAF